MTASDPASWPDAYGDRLYRYALARVRDPRAAEELVQDALLTAFEKRAAFRGDSSELTWLTGFLRFKILESFRNAGREVPLEPELEGEDDFEPGGHWRSHAEPKEWGGDPVSLSESAEFGAALRACLDGLAAAVSRAFVLREMEGLGHHETAEALGVTPSHAAVLLYRARLRLRRCLERSYFAKGAA